MGKDASRLQICKYKCDERRPKNRNKTVITMNNKYIWGEHGKKEYKRLWNWLHHKHKANHYDTLISIDCALDCFVRSGECTEWKWEKGSRPYFWRWGEDNYKDARDGPRVMVKGELPSYKTRQRLSKDKEVVDKVRKKIEKVRANRYICKGEVESLTSYFDVPKDKTDIRMVYNATSLGLNEAVFAPWFALSTVESHLRAVDVNTFMGDNDIGEMFLNFLLDVNICKYAGVDLTDLLESEGMGRRRWERWERLLMGFCPSPYLTTREMKKVEERTKGNRKDKHNIFRWDKVVLNLPGSNNYDPSKPWVYKAREDGVNAGDLFSYVNDYKNTTPSKQECWEGEHQVGCRLTFHGIQDASRKRREPSREPGAWAGSIIHTDGEKVQVLVSQKKWDKTKAWVDWLFDQVEYGG